MNVFAKDVLIVGGGLAGLACAIRLHEAGARPFIFEGSDGIGGRVRTDHLRPEDSGCDPEGIMKPNPTSMKGVKKQNLPSKNCLRCQRPFAWRKKWARNWENVRYCCDACRRGKIH